MKNLIQWCVASSISLLCLCSVFVDNPTSPSSNNQPPDNRPSNQRITRKIAGFFPFENNANLWHYSESGGNTVMILVSDTISDDATTYFRVSFRENRVDTTDDWFLRSTKGIFFGQSLAGDYDLFLPLAIDSLSGSFTSAGSTVDYSYYDSLVVNNTPFHGVLRLRYSRPIIHGFDEITLADSIGIVALVDHGNRWPVSYAIDSCRVGTVTRKF